VVVRACIDTLGGFISVVIIAPPVDPASAGVSFVPHLLGAASPYRPGGEDLVSFEGIGGGSDLVAAGPVDKSLFLLNRPKVRLEAWHLIRRAGRIVVRYFGPRISTAK
jgi:hypothetical protein